MTVPAIRVSGAALTPSIETWQREAWNTRSWATLPIVVYEIQNALVLPPHGMTFRADGSVVSSTAEYMGRGAVARATQAFQENVQRAVTIEDDALLAARPGNSCYGHIITEILGSAWAGAPLLADRPFSLLVWAPPEGFGLYEEVAQCVGLLRRPLIKCTGLAPLRVRRLYVVDGFAFTDHYLSPLLADFAKTISARCAGRGPARRKLYVVRPPDSGRCVRNDEEVWRELEPRGFELVRPESLPWREQVRLFAEASHVVGTMGSALANTMFCPPGARMLTFAPACMSDSFFWRVAGIVGVDYEEIRCSVVSSARYEKTKRGQDQDVLVDVGLLRKWLDGSTAEDLVTEHSRAGVAL